MNPYSVLGIDESADLIEAGAAYKALVQIYHPDRYADAPQRVREEAERRMKDVTSAIQMIKSGEFVPGSTASNRSASARPGRPAGTVDLTDDAKVAEPLEPPTGPHSRMKWDVACKHWSWSESLFAWVCEHDKEVCPQCGRNPDVIAVHDGGGTRPANTWRRNAAGIWICTSHRDQWCRTCAPLADDVRQAADRTAAAAGGPSVQQRPSW